MVSRMTRIRRSGGRVGGSAALHNGDLHVYPQATNPIDGFLKGGSCGVVPMRHEPCLGSANILVACPWPDHPGHSASPVGQVATGSVVIAMDLCRGYGQFQKMEKQQIPEIEPYLIHDATGFRTPGAGIPAQFFHWVEQRPLVLLNRVCQGFGLPKIAPVLPDVSAQRHVGCFPVAIQVG